MHKFLEQVVNAILSYFVALETLQKAPAPHKTVQLGQSN